MKMRLDNALHIGGAFLADHVPASGCVGVFYTFEWQILYYMLAWPYRLTVLLNLNYAVILCQQYKGFNGSSI